MVVICPNCKIKLKIPDEKISHEGSRFKCPKCTTVLLVKKPVKNLKELDKNKILIANGNSELSQKITSLLESEGFTVISSPDGVDAMIKAVKESPYLAIVDVALPKIFGFEVCKRLKSREETKDIKVILSTSVYDKNRYKRQPSSLYGADEFVEDHQIESTLVDKVRTLLSAPASAGEKKAAESAGAAKSSAVGSVSAGSDEWVTRAQRLARTVLSDIFLYNPQKAEDALRGGNFVNVFSSEIGEGRKIYNSRIPKDVRDQNDFFQQELDNFLEVKKKELNI